MNTSLLAVIQSSPEVAYPPIHQGITWGNVLVAWIPTLVGFAIWVFIIFTLVRFFKFLGSARKEQQLIRFELGKLAEEVHQIRKELKAKE